VIKRQNHTQKLRCPGVSQNTRRFNTFHLLAAIFLISIVCAGIRTIGVYLTFTFFPAFAIFLFSAAIEFQGKKLSKHAEGGTILLFFVALVWIVLLLFLRFLVELGVSF
jgi:hypothetical protein